MSRRAHERAIEAAKESVARLPLTEEEKAVAVGIAYDRFKSVSLELARGGASRATVSAVFTAAIKYNEVFRSEIDRQ